jgi:hypothetical protein
MRREHIHSNNSNLHSSYCICVDSICEGQIPIVRDAASFVIYETEDAAQREIVDAMMTRLQEFLDGEREYDDAITVEEYVVPVQVHSDGTILPAYFK